MAEKDSSRIIVLKRYSNPMEAQIVKTRLEDAGISCFIPEDTGIILTPVFKSSLSGIPLFVLEVDYAAALLILEEKIELE